MASLQMSVPHALSRDDAIARIKNLLQGVKQEHGEKIRNLEEHWTDDGGTFRFSAMGFDVSGTVTVTPTEVQLSGNLPFAASFFKTRIEDTIRERAAALLA